MLDSWSKPFTRVTEPEAAAALAELWSIQPTALERLETERDDTFRVRSERGDYVLKIANPADAPLLVNLQTAALAYATELEPQLPLPGMLLTVEGELEPEVHGRVARLMTWLPGSPLDGSPGDDARLTILGETLGRLTAALETFDHPAAHREFAWDGGALGLIRDLQRDYGNDETAAAFDLYDERVAPLLPGLPHQVIHNDFHPGNVLVDEADPRYVVGVLDFGDVIHTARVIDLSVALCYLEPVSHPAFIEGFERMLRLTDDERTALPGLIAARFVQRILINGLLSRGGADTAAPTLALAQLLERHSR